MIREFASNQRTNSRQRIHVISVDKEQFGQKQNPPDILGDKLLYFLDLVDLLLSKCSN